MLVRSSNKDRICTQMPQTLTHASIRGAIHLLSHPRTHTKPWLCWPSWGERNSVGCSQSTRPVYCRYREVAGEIKSKPVAAQTQPLCLTVSFKVGFGEDLGLRGIAERAVKELTVLGVCLKNAFFQGHLALVCFGSPFLYFSLVSSPLPPSLVFSPSPLALSTDFSCQKWSTGFHSAPLSYVTHDQCCA